MAKPKPKTPRKSIKEINQNQNHQPQKSENPPSWLAVRSLFTRKDLQTQHPKLEQQHSKKEKKHQHNQEQDLEETSNKCKKINKERILEETSKKCKKINQEQALEKTSKQCKKINQEQALEETTKKCKKINQEQAPLEETSKKCKKINQEHAPLEETSKKWKKINQEQVPLEETSKKCKKIKCSGSLCSNTKVMQRPEIASPELQRKRVSVGLLTSNNNDSSSRSMKAPLNEINGALSSTNSSLSVSSNSSISNVGSFKGMPFRRLSGCYECRMVDPVLGFTRDLSLRSSICPCPECGEIFVKAENLELHQAVRHAVSELGPEDTSKNIVEIIFQSSWLKKEVPICQIDRILKVHNTQRTISRFEEYRDSIKAKANKLSKKHPRCIADGNELLRFHCTSFACSLGLNGSSNLCNSIPNCNVCSIIKNGFKESTNGSVNKNGILTTATSGKAHDKAAIIEEGNGRAMLVCRIIAGRVKKNMEGNMEEYDSVAGAVGVYSNLDELYVFNPKAILPCFVVIYGGL